MLAGFTVIASRILVTEALQHLSRALRYLALQGHRGDRPKAYIAQYEPGRPWRIVSALIGYLLAPLLMVVASPTAEPPIITAETIRLQSG